MRQPFRKASVYIALLLILEAVTGLAILIVTAYYNSILCTYLEDIQCRLLSSSQFNIYIFGTQLLFTFLCSLTLWKRVWKRRCTPNVQLMLSIWLFYCCVIVASGFGIMWNFYYNIDVLISSAENSLLRGIDDYYSCPEWKLLWDGLQLRKQCCGVYDYKDWMNADWMPQRDKGGSNNTRSVLAPIACFKRANDNNYMMGSEEYSQSNMNKRHLFPTLTIDSINQNGCLSGYTDTVWRYFYILLLLILLCLKFLIFLCCFTKYILQRQNMGDGRDNVGLVDEDGLPLVLVKYPRNVRCVMVGEDDLASDVAPDFNYCNCEDNPGEACECCEG